MFANFNAIFANNPPGCKILQNNNELFYEKAAGSLNNDGPICLQHSNVLASCLKAEKQEGNNMQLSVTRAEGLL